MEQNGSRSFQDMFHEHYPHVFRKLLSLVGEREIAEDLAQNVFLKLYKTPPDDLNKVSAWLNKVATTTAYDHLRLKMRQLATQEKEQNRQLTLLEPNVPSSEQLTIDKWEKELVTRALSKLSDRDREALLLKQQGYSYAEIADMLAVNPALVGTILGRATERFKKHFLIEEGTLQ
jgi:RNA polymerase sigma factor (sigma-70 family)